MSSVSIPQSATVAQWKAYLLGFALNHQVNSPSLATLRNSAQVRNLTLRDESRVPRKTVFSVDNLRQTVGYLVGTAQETVCNNCAHGRGICAQCITVATQFAGSCTNCAMLGVGATCSFNSRAQSGDGDDSGDDDDDSNYATESTDEDEAKSDDNDDRDDAEETTDENENDDDEDNGDGNGSSPVLEGKVEEETCKNEGADKNDGSDDNDGDNGGDGNSSSPALAIEETNDSSTPVLEGDGKPSKKTGEDSEASPGSSTTVSCHFVGHATQVVKDFDWEFCAVDFW